MGKVGAQHHKADVGLREFLTDYPGMAIRPSPTSSLVIEGGFAFTAERAGFPEISDIFRLRIEVPPMFPRELPVVGELDGKIPRDFTHHVFTNGTLCLGSPVRLLSLLVQHPTLRGFARFCLVPYLYGISHKLKFGGSMPFGELDHGGKAVLEDYVVLFRLERIDQALRALRLLGMKKRRANKLQCPCDCGRRLGVCQFNGTLAKFRKLASRTWFRRRAVEAVS